MAAHLFINEMYVANQKKKKKKKKEKKKSQKKSTEFSDYSRKIYFLYFHIK